MKPTILVYCGEDGCAAKALAVSLRDGNSYVIMCAASAFDGVPRHGDRIVFANDVPQRLKDTISAAHGLSVEVPDGQDLAGCKMFQADEKITIATPVKRPRGRPRKVAA